MLVVQNWLGAARDKLLAELDKGAARDKSFVTSYEKSIEELKDELKMHTSTVVESSCRLMGNARTGWDCSAYSSLTFVKKHLNRFAVALQPFMSLEDLQSTLMHMLSALATTSELIQCSLSLSFVD